MSVPSYDAATVRAAQADAWMTGHGVKDPSRMTAMLAPGFPD